MIIRGSLNYTTSGRKKKSYTKKRKTKEFVPMFPKKDLEFKPTWWEKERQERKSAPFKPFIPRYVPVARQVDTSYRREISAKYTIAPAYNKGAYQVIGKDNVKDIGK